MAILEVRLIIHVTLDPNREHDAHALAYMTADQRSVNSISPNIVASDVYQTRLVERAGGVLGAVAAAAATAPNTIDFTVRMPLNRPDQVCPDTSLCLHVFCEVSCPDGLSGDHTCGWVGITLVGLRDAVARGERAVVVHLRDSGAAPRGVRGSVDVMIPESTAELLLHGVQFIQPATLERSAEWKGRTRVLQHTSPGAGSAPMFEDMMRYDEKASVTSYELSPTSPGIVSSRIPMYISCGGSVVRPPCAFLMTTEIPQWSEEYYIRALDAALARKFPLIEGRDERLKLFVSDDPLLMSHDERGAVLMDVAMFIPTACSYLFDEVISRDGSHLIRGEEFFRNVAMTMCGDCEDFSFTAAMVLAWLLQNTWESPLMQYLQHIRARYICTVAYKSVLGYTAAKPTSTSTSTAASGGGGGGTAAAQPPQYGAHDCCDLIPITRFIKMLGKRTVVDGILVQRLSDGLLDHKIIPCLDAMSVVMGEGTTRMGQFVRSGEPCEASALARLLAREPFALTGIRSAAQIEYEDSQSGSEFYQFTLASVVHDTLLFTRDCRATAGQWIPWEVPQVTFITPTGSLEDRTDDPVAWRQRGMTLGLDHRMYSVCQGWAVASVAPTREEEQIMQHLERFELPIIQPAPPAVDTPAFEERKVAVDGFVERIKAHKRQQLPLFYRGDTVGIFVSLWELSDTKLAELETHFNAASNIIQIVAHHYERVVDGVAWVAFYMIVSLK